MLIFFFLIWFCVFYLLPHIVLIMITSVDPNLANLKGLNIKRSKDNHDNLLSIKTNYNKFIENLEINDKIKKYSVVIKILKTMCDDAEHGKKYPSDLYLSLLRNIYDRFFSIMLLCSFFPVLLSIICTNGNIKDNIYPFFIVQLVCIFLVFIANIFIKHVYAKFNECFFRNWYDKILNFDLIAINEIKSNIQEDVGINNESVMADLLSKFVEMNDIIEKKMTASTSLLTEKLDGFMKLKQEDKFVSHQDVLAVMQSGVEEIGDLIGSYKQITKNINTALSGIHDLVSIPAASIDAINNNAALLKALKDEFIGYKEASYTAELAQLEKITTALEKNINNSFVSIDTTVKKTTQTLNETYERFFEMCTRFNETHSALIESEQMVKLLEIFTYLNNKLDVYSNKIIEDTKEETCK